MAKKIAARRAVAKVPARKAVEHGRAQPKPERRTVKEGPALVVVESPAKARTINKYLGRGYVVKASMGHVRDLPKKTLGVDVDRDFTPEYETIKGREKVLADLRKTAKTARAIYLAADPDREGEAICWHLREELKASRRPVHRVLFNEITPRAIKEAFERPGEIDLRKVDSQQARRILDRLVGYKISPLLWDKVRRGISAGRVQSVALRLIVDREAEIRAFVPVEYWSVEARLAAALPPEFAAKLHRWDGEKVSLGDGEAAQRVVEEVRGATFRVAKVVRKEKRRNPVAPFITSKLQQEAARKLHFTARRTMQIAQQLYEGVELGAEGAVGLITYMRTDSPRVSPEATAAARELIAARYGPEFLPDSPPVYRSPRGAQEAHEAIRPTAVERNPSSVASFLARDQLELYTLIWNRFVASQMRPAVFDTTTVDITAGRATFRATGMIMRFAGFMQVYVEGRDEVAAPRMDEAADAEPEEGAERQLPPLDEGQVLECRAVTPDQHFTQPPPRFTEASLVKELEERGIGRPSTYATILSVIQNRDYVVKDAGKFKPTELGEIVVRLLCESFPRIMDYEFTARMEGQLDKIEEGEADWLDEMRQFYTAFAKWLSTAKDKMTNIKAMEEKTDITCNKCGQPMVIKWGRFGKFLACSGYPECKNTREIDAGGNGGPAAAGDGTAAPGAEGNGSGAAVDPCENCGRPMVPKRGRFGPFLACSGYPECRTVRTIARGAGPAAPPPQPTDERCEKCGSPMVIKDGRFGRFLACSAYPKCKQIKSIPLGVDCPQCGRPLTERRSKRGRIFFSCTGYPKCTFALWDRPVAEPCPACGAKFLVEKRGRGGATIRCAADGCEYQRPATEGAAAPAAASR
jgi:DNA topoisomerase-1